MQAKGTACSNAKTANVIGCITSMDTARSIKQLSTIATRLIASNRSALSHAEMKGPTFVSLDRHALEMIQEPRRCIRINEQGAITGPSNINTKETLFITVGFPLRPQITEAR